MPAVFGCGRMTDEKLIGKDYERINFGLLLATFLHLIGGAEENHEETHSRQPMSHHRYKLDTSRV
jgi:hypothetical protein